MSRRIGLTQTADSVPFEGQGFDADNVADGIIEAKSDAINLPRFPLSFIHNAILSDGQLVGVSNLVNVPLVVPVKSQIVEITFYQDGGATKDGEYRFYKGDELPGNLFFTWTLTNTTSDVAISTVVGGTDFTSPIFLQGDLLRVYFDSIGQNHSDVTMFVYFQAVE